MSENQSSVERIGEFLVKIGAITQEQVDLILEEQKSNPGKLFGEIAIEKGFVNDSAIERYLKRDR